jgi:hypothetical protein
MITGQVPFDFTGVLKVNPETDEAILEPHHSLEAVPANQAERPSSAIERDVARPRAAFPTGCATGVRPRLRPREERAVNPPRPFVERRPPPVAAPGLTTMVSVPSASAGKIIGVAGEANADRVRAGRSGRTRRATAVPETSVVAVSVRPPTSKTRVRPASLAVAGSTRSVSLAERTAYPSAGQTSIRVATVADAEGECVPPLASTADS